MKIRTLQFVPHTDLIFASWMTMIYSLIAFLIKIIGMYISLLGCYNETLPTG